MQKINRVMINFRIISNGLSNIYNRNPRKGSSQTKYLNKYWLKVFYFEHTCIDVTIDKDIKRFKRLNKPLVG